MNFNLKKLTTICLACFSTSVYAQSINVDDVIDNYIVYIQDVNSNELFYPDVQKRNITIDGKQIEQDVTYYSLGDDQIFSIIIQTYDDPEVKTTYYFKENEVIAVFIEESNFSSRNTNKKFRNYFLKEGNIILEEPQNSALDYQFFIDLGATLAKNYLLQNTSSK